MRDQKLLSKFSLFFIFFISCSDKKADIPYVLNNESVHRSDTFLSLEKLHSISTFGNNYEISLISDMDADSDNNLYVLAPYGGQVVIFNEEGVYQKTLGNKGQGPQELQRAMLLSYFQDQLYILDRSAGIKVWDKNGNYVRKFSMKRGNHFFMEPSEESFLILVLTLDGSRTDWKYDLRKFSPDLEHSKSLYVYKMDRNLEFYYQPEYAVAVDHYKFIYMSDDNLSYSIARYTEEGKPEFSFGRKFNKEKFSEDAQQYYKKRFGGDVRLGIMGEMQEYPPVVRKIMVDSRNYLWIVLGETTQDVENVAVESQVDIFDENGLWLYSFKTSAISGRSFIKNNRLYSVSPISSKDDTQSINVFTVVYTVEKNN